MWIGWKLFWEKAQPQCSNDQNEWEKRLLLCQTPKLQTALMAIPVLVSIFICSFPKLMIQFKERKKTKHNKSVSFYVCYSDRLNLKCLCYKSMYQEKKRHIFKGNLIYIKMKKKKKLKLKLHQICVLNKLTTM